jgi:hypothetical protein
MSIVMTVCEVRTLASDMPKTNRLPVDLSARYEPHPQTCPADGTPHLDATCQRWAFVEQICLTLFDRWCEQRNVLALAYLMHGWPLAGDDPSLARRLLQSLRELWKYHQEALLSEDAALLSLLLDCE